MKQLRDFVNPGLRFIFTDIDGTLTDQGRLTSDAYQALWRLHARGLNVVPVTGRPSGWCELIARQWPVAGIVGENGGFYFRYVDRNPNEGTAGIMLRHYFYNASQRADHNRRLDKIRGEILARVPGAAVASDQFCRQMDLAIDYCEDVVRLSPTDVDRIVEIFKAHGANAKVSSIHVNGWFGDYDKLTMCKIFLEREFDFNLAEESQPSFADASAQNAVAFIGDSPNDEPMFAFFKNSFAVANINDFAGAIKSLPEFIAIHAGGSGFAEIVEQILEHSPVT